MIHQSKGKLIVIEGGDGSGKGTQSALLREYFEKNSIPYAYVDLPDYESTYGKIIARFLRGEFGSLEEISPYFVGTLFALDRSLIKDRIVKELSDGKIVLANRYVTSNIAHQGSKFADKKKLAAFIQWIQHFEYGLLGLPKEDLVLYLHVPWQIAKELTKTKDTRAYLQGESIDIQERDESHRMATQEMYCYLAENNDHWTTIDCTKNGTILPKAVIHNSIIQELQKNGIIA